MATRRVILLGPQRTRPIVRDAVASLGLGPRARLAAITAGWEEREPEDLELGEHLGGRVVNLEIFRRGDDVYQRDPDLHRGMRERHDLLRDLQELYRLRLGGALQSARELLARREDLRLIGPERAAAIEAVREVDRHHLRRVAEIQGEFEADWRLAERDAVARHRRELAAILAGADALLVAGGHVAILRNRMRLFEPLEHLGDRPVVAWSAGAMALGEKIVLFHDSPPQGAGDAEVLGPGLDACRGVLPLPHASRRLRLGDRARVELFARRFSPDACAALDDGCQIAWDGAGWRGAGGVRRLTADGALVEIGAA